MTKNKGGRPRKDDADKQSCRVTANFTPADYGFIERQSDRAGIPPREFVRLAAMGQPVKERISREQMRLLRTLFGMANNINQAMHLAHSYNLRNEPKQVRRKLDDILDLINQIRLS